MGVGEMPKTKVRDTKPGVEPGSLRPGAGPRAGEGSVPAKPRSDVRAAAAWAAAGFIVGSVFWQAGTIWSLLSDVGIHGVREARADDEAARPGRSGLPEDRKPALPTIYLVDPSNCTALFLDRGTNKTVVQPCPSSGLALRLEPERPREDLAGLASANMQAARTDAD